MEYTKPIVAIYGPTASGKSDLAMDIARRFNGEIICADSRTIYRGMDIGTAKPSSKDQQEIPHHVIDIVDPGDTFSAYDFKKFATIAIKEIHSKGKLPIVVGGTGLYMDALLYDYQFAPKGDAEMRIKLEKMTLEELYSYCRKNNIKLPENDKNKRYVVRNIERQPHCIRSKRSPISTSIIVGISTDKDTLRKRIAQRIEHMFEHGVVEEATLLGKKYGWDHESMTGNIYRLIRLYLSGELSLDEVKEKSIQSDWKLVRRQLTWLRRNSDIYWGDAEKAEQYIIQRLEKSE